MPPMGEAAGGGAAATTNTTTDGSNGSDAIPVTAVAMKLLDVRLKLPGAIICSASGEFTGPGQHEIAILRTGGTLELQRIVQQKTTPSDDEDETPRFFLKLISRIETRSILRSCSVIRFTGDKRDVLAVGADGGALSVVDFTPAGNYKLIHCQIFGKTGCRRATPGQYVASDPKGRAVMISAIEKRKHVYVLNRDATGKPTIASPLDAHRTRSITFATVGLDNGFDNPIFATLELQYPELEETDDDDHDTNNGGKNALSQIEKQLAYYELDLGLNHVSRRWATTTHRTACCLAPVPGGEDEPGGVLVGGEDYIEYLHESTLSFEDAGKFNKIICPIPRRALHPKDKGILITCIRLHRQKKSKFFALAQSELGDVYKVTLTLDPENKLRVLGMTISLLDTLPVANSLNVSKLGMLFVAAEFGDHHLYQFVRIDIADAPTCTSDDLKQAYLADTAAATTDAMDFCTTANAAKIAPTFHPTMLQNLRKIYTMDNPSPTTGVMVGELAGNEVSPQIYCLTGRGPRSSLRILRHGASVTELAVSELPGVPGGIFTIADNSPEAGDGGLRNDQYIVVSFMNATLVLSVGETVEEVGRESGFVTNAPTLACSALGTGTGALVQVHNQGVRQIQKGKASQWHCPGLKRIECASANRTQVVIALAGGEVIYFELDKMSGNLTETATRDMGADVCCLDVGTISKGQSRSLFAAVGCRDQTVRLVSLEPGNLLTQLSNTVLKSRPHSVILQIMTNTGNNSDDDDNEAVAAANLKGHNNDVVLVIGLDDGSSLRASVDPVKGTILTQPTRRFLGARPVSIARISLESRSATLLLSSRPWISRLDAASGKHIMAPLSYAPLDHGCSFSSEAVREGVVATSGKTLRILSVDTTAMEGGEDEAFNSEKVDLRYTPRQMTLLSTAAAAAGGGAPDQRKILLAVVESDYNDYGLEEKKSMGFDPDGKSSKKSGNKSKDDDDGMDMDEDSDEETDKNKKENENDNDDDEEDAEEKEARKTPIRGPVPPSAGHWGSCIRLLDPSDSCSTLDCIEMTSRNEAALCCASVRFHTKGGEPLLAVGTVSGMKMHPLRQTSSHIILYRIINGDRFQLLHRTTVDDGPVLSLAHFQGRLLVGIGKSLKLYEMGKRQLLRKCELRGLPTYVKTLQTAGDRAFFGDMMQSVQIVRYDVATNRLVLLAGDPSPRPIVSQELLDWNTVAVGDKFGNITVLRLPRGSDLGAVDLTGQRALWDSSREDSTTPKLEVLCQYYVGEVVTSMTRSSLVAGGAESLIYVTVGGRIGALVPLTSRDDVEFFTQLESSLRTTVSRPTGRNPQAYRSYYAPVSHVIDGELCDAFNSLSHQEQSKIAERLDRTVGEIMKKLEDTRNALL